MQNSRYASLRKRSFLVVRLLIGVGILVYLARSGQINLSSLMNLLHKWPLTTAAIFFFNARYPPDVGPRFPSVSQRASSLSLANSLQLNLIGFLFSTFLPGAAGGDIAKLRLRHQRKSRASRRSCNGSNPGSTGRVVLAHLAATTVRPIFPRSSAKYLRLAPTALFRCRSRRVHACRRGRGHVLLSRPRLVELSSASVARAQKPALRVFDAMAAHGKARGTLLFALILSLSANLCLIVVTGLGLYAVSPRSFSARLVLVAPMGHLVNSLPLTPGGIGVGESAFNSLFNLTGMNGGAETLLCVRVWNISVGLLGLLVYFFGLGRIVHPYEEEAESEGNTGASYVQGSRQTDSSPSVRLTFCSP